MTLVHFNARLMLSSASDFISFLHVYILFCLFTFYVNMQVFFLLVIQIICWYLLVVVFVLLKSLFGMLGFEAGSELKLYSA